jgi:hypothetical protein
MSNDTARLVQRRVSTLYTALASLDIELADWRTQSQAGQKLEKHNSQIARLSDQLQAMVAQMREDVEALNVVAAGSESTTDLLTNARDLERKVLEAHQLWEFFRSKFAMRWVPPLQGFLTVTDALAWDCYTAVRSELLPDQVPADEVKQPPLTFFVGALDPYLLSRNHNFSEEVFPGTLRVPPHLQTLVQKLPIPMVGVPWHVTRFLPAALIVCHEIGHAMEDDFKLTELLIRQIDAAGLPEKRTSAWHAWLGEVFADLCGAVAAGPAFVGMLADRMARSATEIENEVLPTRLATGPYSWTSYPTRFLRVLVVCEALRQIGFKKEADERESSWRTAYTQHKMEAFEEDIPEVVAQLVSTPFAELRGKTLGSVLALKNQQQNTETAKREIKEGAKIISTNVRQVLVAARMAFEEQPDLFQTPAKHDKIVRHLLAEQTRGVLAGNGPKLPTPAEQKQYRLYDAAAGRRLYTLLKEQPAADHPDEL